METNSKPMVPIIESNYANFTRLEKMIADFFLNNEEKMDFSAKTIAKKLFVSEASLSRFAKKCGCKGYREFIYQYENSFVEKNYFASTQVSAVMSAYQELLNKAYLLIDEAQIGRITEYFAACPRVFVCGMGYSGLAAQEMGIRFMRVGVDIRVMTDSDLIKMHTVLLNKSSLAIGITMGGEKEEILFFLQEAHKRGAKTILITAENKESFRQFCDEILLVPTRRGMNLGNVISPQFPVAIMIDLLYSCYTEKDKYSKEMIHTSTILALQGSQVGKWKTTLSDEEE